MQFQFLLLVFLSAIFLIETISWENELPVHLYIRQYNWHSDDAFTIDVPYESNFGADELGRANEICYNIKTILFQVTFFLSS